MPTRTSACIGRPARGTDRTVLKTYNAKVNWQATSKDMVNFLFFNGDKIKEGRAPGNALFEPTSARWNQGNYYTDNPFHGLWKIEDNRVFSNSLFVTGKYAYYNTGFALGHDRAGHRADGHQRGCAARRLARPSATTTSVRSTPSTSTATPSGRSAGRATRSSSAWAGAALTSTRRRSTRATASSLTRTRRPTSAPASIARAPGPTAPSTSMPTWATASNLGRVTLDLGVRYDQPVGSGAGGQATRGTRRSPTWFRESSSPATTRPSRGRTSRRASA